MYTDCPGCKRQFHINAEQLSAAKGLVKCGFCGQQFSALDRLHDKPVIQPKPGPPVIMEQEHVAEPQFLIPEPNVEISEENVPETPESPQSTTEYEFTDDETSVASTENRDIEYESDECEVHEIPNSTAESESISDETTVEPAETREMEHGSDENSVSEYSFSGVSSDAESIVKHAETNGEEHVSDLASSVNFDFSEALLEQQEKKPRFLNRLLWGTGILIMVLFAAAQIIWFNRDAVMHRYPQSFSWFNQICEKFECEIIRHRDPSAIHMLNRDVRSHFRYKDALLVNATMSNQSHTLQAFPEVQLNLYNTEGNLIAYRRFQPKEYLDDSINILHGMAPNVPVHFVLEVLGSAEGAVSFEFEFR